MKNRLTVGVVGAGAISDIYLRNMTSRFPFLNVVSICSAHMDSAREKAAQYHLAPCTLEEMLEDPGIDMIVNLTPVGEHEKIIRAALMHGKHVYTEKTMTDSPEKAAELSRLAEQRGLRIGCAPDTFLGSALQTARKAVDDGLLGEIHSFSISATRRNDLLLSLFSFLREPGAGILYDYAVYYLTALVSILGPVARTAAIVSAPYPTHTGIIPGRKDFGKAFSSPNESQVSAILQLKSGVTGTLHIDADSYSSDEAFFSIYGTRGILRLTDPNQFGGEVRFLQTADISWQCPEAVVLPPVSDLSDNCRGIGPCEMAHAILTGKPHRTGPALACHVLDVLTALRDAGGAFCDISSGCERPCPMTRVPE